MALDFPAPDNPVTITNCRSATGTGADGRRIVSRATGPPLRVIFFRVARRRAGPADHRRRAGFKFTTPYRTRTWLKPVLISAMSSAPTSAAQNVVTCSRSEEHTSELQ